MPALAEAGLDAAGLEEEEEDVPRGQDLFGDALGEAFEGEFALGVSTRCALAQNDGFSTLLSSAVALSHIPLGGARHDLRSMIVRILRKRHPPAHAPHLRDQPPIPVAPPLLGFTSRMILTASVVSCAAPKKHVSICRRRSSSGTPSASPYTEKPALSTRTSMRPKCARAASRPAVIEAGESTSSASLHSEEESLSGMKESAGGLRAVATRRQWPVAWTCLASSRPMPEEQPVTLGRWMGCE